MSEALRFGEPTWGAPRRRATAAEQEQARDRAVEDAQRALERREARRRARESNREEE